MAYWPIARVLNPDFWTPERRPGKAAVDWSNPISRGLEYAYFVDSGVINEVVSGVTPSINGAVDVAIKNNLQVLDFGASAFVNNTVVIDDGSWLSGRSAFTLIAGVVRRASGGPDEESIFSNWASSALGRYDSATSRMEFFVKTGAGSTQRGGGFIGTSLGLNTLGHVAFRFDADADLNVFLNGKKSVTTYTSVEALSTNTEEFWLGGSPIGTTPKDFFLGHMLYAYVFNRALTDAEIRKLFKEPYSILEASNDGLFLYSVPEGVGQTIPVGQATESDTAQAITPVKTIYQSLGQTSETDSALVVTPLKAGVVAVGLASETDSALSISPLKTIEQAFGLASETDSALGVTPIKALTAAVGLATETDSALSISPVKDILVALGQATETDSAFSVSLPGVSQIPVGLSSETDSALSISPVKDILISVGQSIETDSALSIQPAKHVALGISAETDSALDISVIHDLVITLGLATETDSALSITYTLPNIDAILQGCPSVELQSGIRTTEWECN